MNYYAITQTFTRLQKLMVTLSHKQTIHVMSSVAEGYDEDVLDWKFELEQSLEAPTDDVEVKLLWLQHTCTFIYYTLVQPNRNDLGLEMNMDISATDTVFDSPGFCTE